MGFFQCVNNDLLTLLLNQIIYTQEDFGVQTNLYYF